MHTLDGVSGGDQRRALGLSTGAFTACFAVWTIFSIIGVAIKQELGLSESEFGLLVATPILTGSVTRLFLGVWTEKYGGRIVFPAQMILTAIATWMLTWASTYEMYLLAALGIGLAGGSFIIGVAYVSRWYPQRQQGTALGIFGAGNVGAAVTKFVAPFVLVAYGWHGVAHVWAIGLAIIAVLFFVFAKDDPQLVARRATGTKGPSLAEQFAPLKNLQVWRFSLYYFFVFGAFVALALWTPHYLIDVYGMDIRVAGMAAAAFSLAASIFRAYGGHLSDRFGARTVMYWTFGFSLIFLFMLSYPPTEYVIQGKDGPIAFTTAMPQWPFVATLFALGFFMSLGKAAVYKHIPVYYPNHVGAVGGLVGMIGGLGGFILPIIFGGLLDLTGIYTSCFALLFGIVAVALVWMHLAIRKMEREAIGEQLDRLPELPEMQPIHDPEATAMPRTLEDWRPEDPAFWESKGRRIARRNLWISVPALLLAFSVWMVWSVVVARLPAIGFDFTSGQLFWLAALPGLSGATLRIFYSFMVPIFGGRLWTTISTASLLIPAIGIGYAVQNPETPFLIFLVLALLCGFGGGNFASSMANISFFFPKAEKGNALALNAGLGNLGVSVMQFLVPLVIVAGVFGTLGGAPQTMSGGGQLWMQNAGFIWVPFIIAATVAAWIGMNDIADAKASFAEQAVIFPAQAQLADVRALHRHLRQLHRVFGGLPVADQAAVPGSERVTVRFPGAVGRRAVAGGNRLGLRQVRRRPRHLLDLHRHDGGCVRRDQLPAGKRKQWQLLGLLRLLHGAVLPDGCRQCLHLPDDPDHHGAGNSPAAAVAEHGGAPPAVRPGKRGDHRLYQRDRGLRRLLYPQGLRHVDRHDRQPGAGAVGVPRLLRHLCGHHLGVLHAPGRAAARHRAGAQRGARHPSRLI